MTMTTAQFASVIFAALWWVLVPSFIYAAYLIAKVLIKCVDKAIELMLYCLSKTKRKGTNESHRHSEASELTTAT